MAGAAAAKSNDSEMPDEVKHELITTALSVERLDALLFRSRTLSVPSRARGVFGGQVISLALVAATECVDKKFSLHVRCPRRRP